jgi:hypothetical protein
MLFCYFEDLVLQHDWLLWMSVEVQQPNDTNPAGLMHGMRLNRSHLNSCCDALLAYMLCMPAVFSSVVHDLMQ